MDKPTWPNRRAKSCMELTAALCRICTAEIHRVPTTREFIEWAGLKVTPTALTLSRRAVNRVQSEVSEEYE